MRWFLTIAVAAALACTLMAAEDKPADPKAADPKPAAPADPKAEPKADPAAPKSIKEKASYGVGMNIGGSFGEEADVDVDKLIEGIRAAIGEKDAKVLREKVSTAIGLSIGRNLAKDGSELDVERVIQGIRASLDPNAKPALTTEEVRTAMIAFSKERQEAAAGKAKGEGETFLAENKKKEGVKVTTSGLQYEVIKEGTGKKPTAVNKVRVHYRGTLTNGSEFDSSIKRGEPAEFEVGQVIKGWTEALQLMPVGSKWRLVIPSDLAYGASGAGGRIPPHAVLVFEVELLGIVE